MAQTKRQKQESTIERLEAYNEGWQVIKTLLDSNEKTVQREAINLIAGYLDENTRERYAVSFTTTSLYKMTPDEAKNHKDVQAFLARKIKNSGQHLTNARAALRN